VILADGDFHFRIVLLSPGYHCEQWHIEGISEEKWSENSLVL
jgi:hypothetical protein